MEKIQLPANLQLIRSVWGMNRKQIGLLVNCKAHQIGGYERGSVSATPSLLFMLEDLTGIAARRLYYEPLTRAILPTEPLRTTETTKNMTPQYLMPSASLEERVQRLEAKVFGTAKK